MAKENKIMSMTESWMTERERELRETFENVIKDLINGIEGQAEAHAAARMSELPASGIEQIIYVCEKVIEIGRETLGPNHWVNSSERGHSVIKLNAEETDQLVGNLEYPPDPENITVRNKTILYNDRARQNALAFVGVCRDDDQRKPFLAVTIQCAIRFETPEGAARWYAQEVGLDVDQVTAAVVAADKENKSRQ